MDQHRFVEQLRIQHRHEDGRWADMVEDAGHVSPSDHDFERAWANRRIYKCTECEEAVTVLPGTEGGPEVR